MDITLQWLAGFFDGEGCVGLHKGSPSRNTNYHPRVTITNIDLPTLKAIQAQYGGSIHEATKKESVRPCWMLVWSTQKALSFLRLISPHLIVKKSQAEVLLAGYKPGINGVRLTDIQKEERAQLYSKLREMKRINPSLQEVV
jgi:hypothetical protein